MGPFYYHFVLTRFAQDLQNDSISYIPEDLQNLETLMF